MNRDPAAGGPATAREALLEQVLAQAYNSVVITDARFDHGGPFMTYVNPAFCAMTGYAEHELLGRSPRILQGPDTDRAVIDRLRACLHEARFFEGETVNYRKDGTPYRVRWNISPVRAADGSVTHFASVQRDVTVESDLQTRQALLALALDGAFEAIAVLDREGRFVFVNEAWERLAALPRAALVGRPWTALDAGEDEDAREWNELLAESGGGHRFATVRRPDGSTRLVDRSVAPVRDPVAGEHVVVVAKDVTDRLRQVESLLERADLDALTGTLTRAAGDRVLAGVAEALRACVRAGDLVVRWGGEEFLVALPGLEVGVARRVAERVRTEVAARDEAGVPAVTASIGLAARRPGEALDALVERADVALYAAKEAGRDRVRLADG